MCVDHKMVEHAPPVATPAVRVASDAKAKLGSDHSAKWYKKTGRVTLTQSLARTAVANAVDATAASVAAAAVADPVTFSTNAAGLPLLNSRSDGQGLKVFIDWDGASGNGFSDDGFSTDSDLTTFNTAEQAVIYSTWRDIVSAFSMLNVNVTTVQPPVGGNNPAFVWQRITNSRAGGAAYVNWIVNYESHGYNNSDNALYRHSGIYHELGHQLGLDHQSAYDDAGNKTAEYTSGFGARYGPIMGGDFHGFVKKWYFGRDGYAADSFQDDISDMAGTAGYFTGTDGFRPDDFTGTTLTTATTLPIINGAYQTAGVISKISDVDIFRFTTAGGAWNVNVEPTYQSPLASKLEIYNSSGTLISSVDDTQYRNGFDNASLDLNLTLPGGTYYAKVSSSGNYSDQGEYAFCATPLPSSWTSVDVNRGNTGRGGYVTYNSSSGTFFQGGSGGDIWGTSDAFRYSYQTLTGDGSIVARVDRLDNTSFNAKAGVMIRQSLDPASAHVYFGLKPNGQTEAIARGTTGGTAYNNFGDGAGGPWVRLTRAGNLFTIARSVDGITWTTTGSTTVAMTGPVTIGLATCSQNVGAQATSSFSNVTVTGTVGPVSPTYNGLAAPANLTAATSSTQNTNIVLSWSDVAGETGYRIERSLDNSNFSTVGTVGANVTTYTDDANGWGSMRYWYRVTALTSGGVSIYSNPATAQNRPGIVAIQQIVRMSPSRYAISWWDVAGDNGYRLERSSNGGSTYTTLDTRPQNMTAYNDDGLAVGTTYTYRLTALSPVGDSQPRIFTITTPPAATTSISLSNQTASSLRISWAAVTGAASYKIFRSTDNTNWTQAGTVNGGSTVSYTDTGLNALTNYYYYVVAVGNDAANGANSAIAKGSTAPTTALPAPWLDADIGSVTGLGDAGPGASPGTFTINTSGNDMADLDRFHFVYQPLTGNTTIVAKIASLDLTDAAAKAGLMIRQNITSDSSPYAGIFINAGNGYGVDVRSRATAGGTFQYGQALANVAAPYWLKLQRAGNVFTMSYSADGTSWTVATTRTVTMTGTVYVGLAATAQSNTLMNASTFTNVSLASAAPTVVTAANASPNPVTGKTTNVSVLGADDGGEASLSYTWTATGPAAVTFSASGTNAAKNAVATFAKAGTYTLTATISDGGFNTVTSSVTVNVVATFAGIAAAQPSMFAGFGQQIATVDQFGDAVGVNGLIWSASAGSISASGFYVAPATGTSSATVTGTLNGTAYNATIAVAAPRAWYKADTAAGTLTDSSGNNLNAPLTTTYTVDSGGKIGSAVNLTGGYATTPTNIVSGLTELTIATWIKPTAATQWARAFDFGTGTTKYMFLAPTAGDGYLRFAATNSGGGGEQQVTTTTAIASNVWSHVALTISGTVATLYVNGVAVGTNNSFTLNPATLGAMTQTYLGKSQYADPTFKGSIDDFRVYAAAASASTVAALYSAGNVYASSPPSAVTATASSPTQVNVAWTDNSSAEVGYVIERATNSAFTAGLTTFTVAANATSYSDTTAAANTTYYYRVTTLLPGGTTAGPVTATPVTTPSAAAAPTVSSFVINDGQAQRAMLTSMTLTFSAPVTLSPEAITLWHRNAAGESPTQITGFVVTPSAGDTVYTLTFPAANGFPSGSLVDGLYEVKIAAAGVTSAGTPMAADATFADYRLYGDYDGTRSVNFNDFLALQNAFGSTTGSTAYNAALDSDIDGDIDFNDFLALQNNFGKSL